MRLLLLLLAVCALPLTAMQNVKSYVILNPELVADVRPYEAALEAANMDKYRYFDKRNTIRFENGLLVELLSAHEMGILGLPVKTERVRTTEPEFDTGSIFQLTPDGVLVEVMTKTKIK
jgi:hypothetical protein